MSAPWLRILAHKHDFGFQTGPTVPFLYGATREPLGDAPSPDAGRRELGALVVELHERAKLQWCHAIEEFAVVERNPGAPFTISDPTGALQGIDPTDVSAITEALWTRYQQPIAKGLFSRDPDERTWRAYRPHERDRIQRALASSN